MPEPSKLKYTETHEWVKLDGNIATVGITDHAQKEISDVVFIELPGLNKNLKRKDAAMVVESVKAAFDIYAPISGKVVKVNEELKNHPELVNQSPYEKGWLFQVECQDAKEVAALLSEADYNNVKGQAHH